MNQDLPRFNITPENIENQSPQEFSERNIFKERSIQYSFKPYFLCCLIIVGENQDNQYESGQNSPLGQSQAFINFNYKSADSKLSGSPQGHTLHSKSSFGTLVESASQQNRRSLFAGKKYQKKQNSKVQSSNINKEDVYRQETEKAPDMMTIDSLFDILEQQYDKYKYTRQFTDPDIESQYLQSYHEKINRRRIPMLCIQLYQCLSFIVSQTVLFEKKMFSIKCIVNLSKALSYGCVLAVLAIIIFFLQKRYIKLSAYTTELQVFVYYVLSMELFILGYKNFERVQDFFPSQLALTAILSMCHYNSLLLALSHFSVLIYAVLRSHFFVHDDYRSNIFWSQLLVELITIYIFSYLSAQNDRELFKRENNQKQLLALFQEFIKIFHDGIIITDSKENILFANQFLIQFILKD